MHQPVVRFRVLGPLEVTVDGRPLPVRGVVQRSALGFLLLNADQVVATSDLVRALWARGAPPTARKMLQNAVSALRGTLTRNGVAADVAALLSHPSGYRFRVAPAVVDLAGFHRLVAQGRADLAEGAWERAATALREGLDLWRGCALADLAETGVAWPALVELKGLRGSVVEDRFEADLACGRHHGVAAELEAAVDLWPDRERLSGQLMLALYRCGRQVEALAVYRRLRTRLGERLGLEPGRDLRLLERAILTHDPWLDEPAALARIAGQGPPAAAARPRPAATGRSPELDVLRGLAALTRSRRRPHLVTVLGPADGLVAELVATAHEDRAFRCLVARTPADVVRSCCGAEDLDPAAARQRLGVLVHGLAGPRAAADLVPCLENVLRGSVVELLAVGRLLELVAAHCPLVVVLENADLGPLRDLVGLIGSGPLLLVATAGPGLDLDGWGSGFPGTTVLTLADPAGTSAERA
ncbi:BTAD domain-containing putative transcriptional regulator [Umezawaea endophytica]|uniref:AfsR/SARP family transcriptional regulator n=1 Tax=Umezawaea endophytica TaxID=1654476 RepID=A0A9X3A574_9PSEU|nr:AfsR/SARP family transcriptional regulator [Umezawaea endophytica]MCS7483524.1 AfsR/SARP family transcriptional regulator [Umezawaea endophytica]